MIDKSDSNNLEKGLLYKYIGHSKWDSNGGISIVSMEKINNKTHVLVYLKSLLEGENIIHVNKWIKNNQEVLKELFTRSGYLKLKFEPIKFARGYLSENLIKYQENIPHCRYEEYLMTFSDEALQSDCSLKKDWYVKVFNGIFSSFFLGDEESTKLEIMKYLKKHQKKHRNYCCRGC